VVSVTEHEDLMGMTKSIMAHKAAYELLIEDKADTELSLFWSQKVRWDLGEVEIPGKARFDCITNGGTIVDLKTTDDASYWGFRRAVKKYRYDLQAAWYLNAARRCGIDPYRFVFIAVEKAPPYAVAAYELAWIDIEAADAHIDRLLIKLAECEAVGVWPGYSQVVETMSLSWVEPADVAGEVETVF
jgi:exodeoxyribonuclease VIII